MGNAMQDSQPNKGGQLEVGHSNQKSRVITKSPAKSELRKSGKKIESSLKVSSTAYQASSRIGSKLKSEEVAENDKFKLTRLPHFNKELPDERGEDYAVEKSNIRQSTKINESIKLSWKLDQDNGISKQIDVYTFDYDRALQHFVDWEKDRKERTQQQKAKSNVQ